MAIPIIWLLLLIALAPLGIACVLLHVTAGVRTALPAYQRHLITLFLTAGSLLPALLLLLGGVLPPPAIMAAARALKALTIAGTGVMLWWLLAGAHRQSIQDAHAPSDTPQAEKAQEEEDPEKQAAG